VVIVESCTFPDRSDASQTPPGVPGTNHFQYVRPTTGAVTSDVASGGVSQAGQNGLIQLTQTTTLPPPNLVP
jgi:hypothetical protein